MTNAVRRTFAFLLRLVVVWLVDAVALLLTSAILPGMSVEAAGETPRWLVALAAAFLLGAVNLLIRPLVLLLARPLGPIALFLVGFLINAAALLITAQLMAGFEIGGFFQAIVGGIVFAAVNVVLTSILELNEDGSFYQHRIERRAARRPFPTAGEPGRGLVMMEIDGLSYHHIQKALADGKLPTLQAMIEEEGYRLSRADCGIPSQTSACQAGIMFGDNDDIPAYRWFDKEKQKLYVSASDATEINARYARGNGLMRGGSSIDNMLNGDAWKSLLTLADLRGGDKEERKLRADDLYLLMLNPYFLMRTIALFFANVVREVWEGWQQKRKDIQPRLDRLAHFYPFMRAATSVVVRDISANLTILDVVRGAPSIYVTWPGYDEVAHHSGPWTGDAFGELKRYDRIIARVRRAIKERAPRPYDLIILSDHGQSFGATFKQRYGLTLKEFIEQNLPRGTTVAQSMGGDNGVTSLAAVSAELENVQQEGVGSGLGQTVAKQGQKLVDRGVAEREADIAARPAQVTAYGSGNLAQVYFDLYPRRIQISELNAAYPGLVDSLVRHEGIGLVCGYDDDGTPIALSKQGTRNLHTGQVTGEDPLLPYARPDGVGAASIEKRVWQVRRVMDFRSAGDLMVISTVYPDGTVAALEELIGSHGGVGGEQTDAFILHPPDMEVPDTRNSTDVFHILNGHRGKPVAEPKALPEEEQVADWAPGTMASGLRQVRTWVGRALRALILERTAYEEIVRDPYMTGPALLIALVALFLTSITQHHGLVAWDLLLRLGLWLADVLAVWGAGYLLSRRGTFTRTFRALGFAHGVYLLQPLALVPVLAPVARLLILVVGFLTTWMGAAAAHEIRGWRTILLPVVATLVFIVGVAVLSILIAGIGLTAESVLSSLGLQPNQ